MRISTGAVAVPVWAKLMALRDAIRTKIAAGKTFLKLLRARLKDSVPNDTDYSGKEKQTDTASANLFGKFLSANLFANKLRKGDYWWR
jgi:hypothetical protein